jgi:MFS family permease
MWQLPPKPPPPASPGDFARSASTRVFWARGLRAATDGFVSLLLPVYLGVLGMTPLQVGVIVTATLLGSGVMTLWVGLRAFRHNYRQLLLLAAALMTGTGIGFSLLSDLWPLLAVAFVGTLNPSGGDVSVFLPLEHAVLAQAPDERRTALFARYSLVGTLVASVGTLLAGLPELLAAAGQIQLKTALQAMFGLYAVAGVLSAWVYRGLPPQRRQAVRRARRRSRNQKK